MGLSTFLVFAGIVIAFTVVGFVLWKVHREEIEAGMAIGLLVSAFLAPIAFSAVGGGFKAKLPGGAEVEGWAKEAKQAAQSVDVDRKQVEAIAGEVRTTADSLRELESRYRKMVGNTASLTYLMWLSRGQFGPLPNATANEFNILVGDLLTEAFPNPDEKAAQIAYIENFSPGYVRMVGPAAIKTPDRVAPTIRGFSENAND